MNYTDQLIKLRKRNKMTQEEVAEKLLIPRTQLVRYEKGINEIPIRYLIELCKLYKSTPNEILCFNTETE